MKSKEVSWKYIRTENTIDLKLFSAQFEYFENPRIPGSEEKMVILRSADSVNIVPLTTEGEMIFVRQFRVGIRAFTLELPGGIIDPGETPLQAAKRELAEETGHSTPDWQVMGKVGANPVFMNSYIHHTVAQNVEETHSLKLDDGEDISLEMLTIEDVRRRLSSGSFLHPHTISGLVFYFNQLA